MASSSKLWEPPSSPLRIPPIEPKSLKRRPFKYHDTTPRASRRSRSIRLGAALRLLTTPLRVVSAGIGKGKSVATLWTPRLGGSQAARTYDSDGQGNWHDSFETDSDNNEPKATTGQDHPHQRPFLHKQEWGMHDQGPPTLHST